MFSTLRYETMRVICFIKAFSSGLQDLASVLWLCIFPTSAVIWAILGLLLTAQGDEVFFSLHGPLFHTFS